MSFTSQTCFVLHCDRCGRAFHEGEGVVHFGDPDPTDVDLVIYVEDCDWTTDGERWHCECCPELHHPVCWSCRRGDHTHCEGLGCACWAVVATPGQETFALGEAADA